MSGEGGAYPMVRMSIPGYECTHCGTVMTAKLTCSGCGWVDPLTRRPADASPTDSGIPGGTS